MRGEHVPTAKAPRGKGPRTKKQARKLRDRALAELDAEKERRAAEIAERQIAR